MTSTYRRTNTIPPSGGGEDLIDQAVEALRREWRAGFNGHMVRTFGLPMVRRLNERAATQQAAATLAEIERRLDGYAELTAEARKLELTAIAAELNALRPHVTLASTAAPVGTLPTAIAPGRATPPKTGRPGRGGESRAKALPTDAPVTTLPRVGESVSKKLGNLHIKTVGDLLTLGPRRHIDYSRTVKIGTILGFGRRDEVTVRGEVVELREIRGPGAPRVQIRLADDSGWIRVTWFNTFVAKQIALGDEIAVSGAIDTGFGPPSFTSPEWERIGGPSLSTGRLTPVYPLTQGLAQKTMRALTRAALDATKGTVEDALPANVLTENELIPLVDAYEHLHYPPTWSLLEAAQRRLGFEDLLLLQLGMTTRKRHRQTLGGVALHVDEVMLRHFLNGLPFLLTDAQQRALDEILTDVSRAHPMGRLLQGDVGSGKTVVAAAAALVAVANGHQAAIMAPTEILAEQHFHNFRGLFAHLPDVGRPHVALLTGSTRAAARREVISGVESGEINVLVGTHAIIQEGVSFSRLAVSIIDEQHRFGVRQRAILPDKAVSAQPHVLTMTATPIPRTLNMVINGDLEVSVIGELPPGRIPAETRRYVGSERRAAYEVVREEVRKGHQVFVICPLVEESEAIEAKAAVAEAERLRRDVFPDLSIATLHGRMSGRDKDAIMTGFRDREYDLLVATSVIEVGIDVPNATVMLVEGADRFGLAQLHQFRGRVGRGGARSYCLLLADETTPEAESRLDLLVETNDGFLLAEKDLELRGPGDFIGTRQSGLPEMVWLDGSFDTRLLDQARQAAERLLDDDPDLRHPDHAALRARLQLFWTRASPDVPL